MSSGPVTLALELSQKDGSIAILGNSGEVVYRNIFGGRSDEDELMPSIADAAKQIGISPNQIELVVVSVGPGGFTGLRTAVATAKMIAYSTGAKLVSVDSPIVVANAANMGDGPFVVLSCIKKDNLWLSTVWFSNNSWKCESQLATNKELESCNENISCCFADTFLSKESRELLNSFDISVYPLKPTAASLLEIGLLLYQQGVVIDPHDLMPTYPREPESVRRWNERRG
ncbi:MAG: tRNA (adenosine(37)-N6)-threonylcarbamoyltransferase complex dimerization subunit type 1 TsaB [Phycisphaerales bacterium]|jgi:tRNA threonylcarbamoyladenosine biosynthesis protein TsaB|nr:tRNA (adenosine(37)-N6)-threonylcarbamoyltransferase complex dimerization subunit type 1 TsaB [Phycisphaerales bacterium]